MLSNITVPLVGAVDVAMMGRLDDPVFIGGVGLGMLVFNFIYFGLGFLRMGTTGLVAQNFGRRADRETGHILLRGLSLAFGLGLIFIVAQPLVTNIAAASFSASAKAEDLMTDYIAIRIFAVPAALANMVLLGGLYGRQQMRDGMALLLLVNGMNLALGLLFVMGMEMTVDGVALASVVAQWVGFAFILWRTNRSWSGRLLLLLRPQGGEGFPDWADFSAYKSFFRLGRDIFLRTILLIGCEALLLNQAAKMDDLALALCQIMLSLFGMIAFAIDGFAHAAEALVGEAVGRKNPKMLSTIIHRTNLLAGLMAVLLSGLLWIGEKPVMAMMTAQGTLIAAMQPFWIWVALLPLASFLAFQMDGIFVGATCGRQMRNAMIFSSACFTIMLVTQPFGLAGLMASFVIYLVVRGLSLWMLLGHVTAQATPGSHQLTSGSSGG